MCCKTMFLNTLSIGEWTALKWQDEDNQDRSEEDENSDGNNANTVCEELKGPSKC